MKTEDFDFDALPKHIRDDLEAVGTCVRPSGNTYGSWYAEDEILESLAEVAAGNRKHPVRKGINTEFSLEYEANRGRYILHIKDKYTHFTLADIASIRWMMIRHLVARELYKHGAGHSNSFHMEISELRISAYEYGVVYGEPDRRFHSMNVSSCIGEAVW